MIAYAPAKIILFGEHAVVYGYPGIAGAIDLTSKCSYEDQDRILVINKPLKLSYKTNYDEITETLAKLEKYIDEGDFEGIRKWAQSDQTIPTKIVVAKSLMEAQKTSGLFVISSEIPLAAGLGSGSSAFASIAASVLGDKRKKVSEIAYLGDVVAHGGTPSGIDNTTVTYGGFVHFKKGEKPKPLKIDGTFKILVVFSGKKAPTGEMVSKVRKLYEQDKEGIGKIFEEMGNIAEQGLDALKEGNKESLAKLFDKNHELLKKIGVSNPLLERLRNRMKKMGCSGVKISGAGGGGVLIGICDNPNITNLLFPFKSWVVNVGVEGIRVIV